LYQVSVALENSSENSLVIIDEFGKGTLPADGIGLFAATLESFASRGALCPRLLTATHFSEIFQYELISPFPNDILAQKTMEVTPLGNEDTQDRGIVFLYRIIPGLAEYSWGLNCAEMAGIHERVLERGGIIHRITILQRNRLQSCSLRESPCRRAKIAYMEC
jgi:DNA mismatch repair protein MSH5